MAKFWLDNCNYSMCLTVLGYRCCLSRGAQVHPCIGLELFKTCFVKSRGFNSEVQHMKFRFLQMISALPGME